MGMSQNEGPWDPSKSDKKQLDFGGPSFLRRTDFSWTDIVCAKAMLLKNTLNLSRHSIHLPRILPQQVSRDAAPAQA